MFNGFSRGFGDFKSQCSFKQNLLHNNILSNMDQYIFIVL